MLLLTLALHALTAFVCLHILAALLELEDTALHLALRVYIDLHSLLVLDGVCHALPVRLEGLHYRLHVSVSEATLFAFLAYHACIVFDSHFFLPLN